MKSQITTPRRLRPEGRGGTREEEEKEMGREGGRGGLTGRDGKRKKDAEITEGRIEEKKEDVRESRIKVDQLHLQIAHAGPWPALPSLWGSLLPDYMKLG